jgi:hypothetical protein
MASFCGGRIDSLVWRNYCRLPLRRPIIYNPENLLPTFALRVVSHPRMRLSEPLPPSAYPRPRGHNWFVCCGLAVRVTLPVLGNE